MAQMTHFASFVPVLVVTSLLSPSSPSSFVWALGSGGGRVWDVLTHRRSSLAAELSLLLGGVGHVSHRDVEMAEVDLEKI